MSEIVPIGKYKGQPVELMLSDVDYCEWLKDQSWFREKFVNIYNVIINVNDQKENTPEHNLLQAKYFDNDMIFKVCAKLFEVTGDYKFRREDIMTKKMENFCDVSFQVDDDPEVIFRNKAAPRPHRYEFLYELDIPTVSIELKPCIGDDYPKVLRQVLSNKELFEKRKAKEALESIQYDKIDYARFKEGINGFVPRERWIGERDKVKKEVLDKCIKYGFCIPVVIYSKFSSIVPVEKVAEMFNSSGCFFFSEEEIANANDSFWTE